MDFVVFKLISMFVASN